MKKTLILAAAFTCAAFTANAALVTTWSGSVWSYDVQENYATDLTIHAANGSSATLVSNVAPGPSAPMPHHHLLDGIFYTFASSPTLTGNISSILPGVQQIIVEITYSGNFTSAANYGLSFNGDPTVYLPLAENRNTVTLPEKEQTPAGEFTAYTQTAVWNVADFNLNVPIDSIQFVLPLGSHVGLIDVTVTQVVPEPSTYALILGGLGLAGVVVARRRRA